MQWGVTGRQLQLSDVPWGRCVVPVVPPLTAVSGSGRGYSSEHLRETTSLVLMSAGSLRAGGSQGGIGDAHPSGDGGSCSELSPYKLSTHSPQTGGGVTRHTTIAN